MFKVEQISIDGVRNNVLALSSSNDSVKVGLISYTKETLHPLTK